MGDISEMPVLHGDGVTDDTMAYLHWMRGNPVRLPNGCVTNGTDFEGFPDQMDVILCRDVKPSTADHFEMFSHENYYEYESTD